MNIFPNLYSYWIRVSVVGDQDTVCFEFFKATMPWAYIQGVYVCVCAWEGGGWGGLEWSTCYWIFLLEVWQLYLEFYGT